MHGTGPASDLNETLSSPFPVKSDRYFLIFLILFLYQYNWFSNILENKKLYINGQLATLHLSILKNLFIFPNSTEKKTYKNISS